MKLQPYQESVLAKGDRPFALHGTGTGKTLTSLKFIERSQKANPDSTTVLVTSSSLRDNLVKEKDKHGVDVDLSKVYTVTHEGMSRPHIASRVKELVGDGGTLVLDEIHKLRNPESKGYLNTMSASSVASKVLGLTGTAIVNDPEDLSNLYNLVQGNYDVKMSKFTREKRVEPTLMGRIKGEKPKVVFEITNPKELKKSFTSLDIYYPPANDPMLPTVTSRVEEVRMPPEQVIAYKNAESQAIKGNSSLAELARKIRAGEMLTKSEAAKQNAFASQTSQAAISSAKHLPGKVYSAKIDKVVETISSDFLDNPEHRSVIYSNKIGAGLDPTIASLQRAGLGDKLQVIFGDTKKSDVAGMVNNYNIGDKPILLISDSGAEGLDLKGTRSIHVLNPHFNDGKIKQAVGRGARFGSHMHLPPEDRRIDVVHYQSVIPKGMFKKDDLSVDQYMHNLTQEKAKRRDMVISVLS